MGIENQGHRGHGRGEGIQLASERVVSMKALIENRKATVRENLEVNDCS